MNHNVMGIVGLQWGDEGKGKLVHRLSSQVDYIARFNGGNNAGHTIVQNGKQYIFHLLPSGLLHPQAKGIIGAGTVINPAILCQEMDAILQSIPTLQGKLFISSRSHLIFPWHIWHDQLSEARRKNKIGTTNRGIGPAYADKISRDNIRMGEMQYQDYFLTHLSQKIDEEIAWYQLIAKENAVTLPSKESILQDYARYAQQLAPYITDDSVLVRQLLSEEKTLLLEGAQGALLDIDHGTYPFVTSSTTTIAGACTGLGLPPQSISRVVGVAKAYTTRVGEGPFPTEIRDSLGEHLQQRGGEFGATTGRARRCGWLDLPLLRQTIHWNGVTEIAIMKLDVLDELDQISVCTHYQSSLIQNEGLPTLEPEWNSIQPVYQNLPGWRKPITSLRCFEDLPNETKNYIHFIEQNLSVPIHIISVGPDDKETIIR